MRKTAILLFCIAVLLQSCGSQRTLWSNDTVTFGNESVIRTLTPLLCDTLFGRSTVGMAIYDLDTDRMIFEHNSRLLLRPGSTMKLVTAITALDTLGKDYLFTTSLGYTGQIKSHTLHGDLICRGGMDPTFNSNDMEAFAETVKSLGIDTIRGCILGDVSMKDSLMWGEGWCWDDENPTLTPLLCNEEDTFVDAFAEKLTANHIILRGAQSQWPTAKDVNIIAEKRTPIAFVMKEMMKESNNLYAESMYYNTAKNDSHPATADDVKDIQRKTILKAGINPYHCRLADGSGLSLYNYLSADLEVKMLVYAYRNPSIYSVLYPTLPIAGVDGTLKGRMQGTAAQGNVHAKTGTVTGVSSLAGYLTAANGHHLAFAIINQGIRSSSEARDFQDRCCEKMAKLKSY